MTPDQWLSRLTKCMDARANRLRLLRRYMDGDAPLPEGADGHRDAYKAFQRKARTNLGEIIVEAVAERVTCAGFSRNGGDQDDDQLRRIYNENQLEIGFGDVMRDMLGLSAGYMMVSEDEPRHALITCERPEQVITDQAPSRPGVARAGLKVYRDELVGVDRAYLHLPGVVFPYIRPLSDVNGLSVVYQRAQGDWQPNGDPMPTGLKFVPIFPYVNRRGLGEFEPHLDILDRINWGILQRLVITAMQAYRQRALQRAEGTPALPVLDDKGNEIDYDKLFAAAPGAMWDLPAGFTLWESGQTDLGQILSATKDDMRDLAAVTRTPFPMFVPDGANQTATGATAANEGLLFKAKDRLRRANAPLVATMGAAVAIEEGLDQIVGNIEALWAPVESRSLQEIADASSKVVNDLPRRERLSRIWGLDGDAIDKIEAEFASQALIDGLSQPVAPPVAPAVPPVAPSAQPA